MNKCAGILALTVLAGLLPATARADVLDKQLFDAIGGKPPEVPTLVEKLSQKGYKNVGVLRFRVQQGDAKPSFTTPLSGILASRVENLLVTYNTPEKPVLGIIHDAGAEANRNKIESWDTSNEARKKLFDLEYPLAWGADKVKPDVFITGTLKLSRDRKQTTVTLQSFDKSSQELVDLNSFSFKTDRNIARGLGASFTVPLVTKRSAADVNVDDLVLEDLTKQDEQDKKEGAAGDGDTKPATEKKENAKKDDSDKKQDDEKKPKSKKSRRPKKRPKKENITAPSSVAGVEVQMLVDDKEAAMTQVSDGSPVRWQVTSPAPGQQVVFRLRNNSAQQVGVVVRLNGISTFQEQKADPEKCQKWVINPGKYITVRGFYRLAGEADGGKKKLEIRPIKVLVGAEAKAAREAFADKAGLIEVDVFQEGNNEEEQGLSVSARGLPPSKERKARESYVSLRDAMIKSAGLKRSLVAKREILVPDTEVKEKGEVEEVPFKNPLLMAHLAVRVMPASAGSGDEGSQDKDK